MKRFLCFIYLILCCYFGACQDGEVNCPDVPGNKEKLSFDLYYDAGTDQLNQNTADMVLGQLCPNKKLVDFQGRVKISFKPGAAAYKEAHGVFACYNNRNSDCTIPMIHACARSALSDEKFIEFVCCSANEPPKGTTQCAVNLGVNEEKLTKCIYHYSAGDILTGNTNDLKSKTKHVTVDTYPAPLFGDLYTSCLAQQSHHFVIHTICKQLADPKPQICSK